MTRDQLQICKALGNVRYLAASWDKRFGQNMAALASREPGKELTQSQTEWIYRLLYKYRKQLPKLYHLFKSHPSCGRKSKPSYQS